MHMGLFKDRARVGGHTEEDPSEVWGCNVGAKLETTDKCFIQE